MKHMNAGAVASNEARNLRGIASAAPRNDTKRGIATLPLVARNDKVTTLWVCYAG